MVDKPEGDRRFTFSSVAGVAKWCSIFSVPTLLIAGLDGDFTAAIALTLALMGAGALEAAAVLVLVVVGVVVYPLLIPIALGHVDDWIVWIAVAYLSIRIVRSRRRRTTTNEPGRYALLRPESYRALLCVAGTTFLILAFFRWFPLLQTIGCMLLVFGMAHLIKARHRLPNISFRKLAANASLTLGSTAVSIVFLELCLPLVLSPDSGGFRLYESSPDHIYRLQPHGQGFSRFKVTESEYRTVSFSISSQGFRDQEFGPKAPDEFRIAMLGDSFTFGSTVAEEDTIPKYLERTLNVLGESEQVSVINAGMNGAGPWQEFGILKDRVLPLEPDLVILQVLLSNDIDNALEKVNKTSQSYKREWYATLQRFVRRNTVAGRAEDWVWHKSRVYREACKASNSQFWIYELVANFRLCPKVASIPIPRNANRPFWLEVNLKEWYPELEEGFQILTDEILNMNRLCREKGIDFVVYAVPLVHETYDDLWEQNMANVPSPAQYEKAKAHGLLYEFLAENAIPHYEVTNEIRDAGPSEATFYMRDGHLSETGNEAVARKTSLFIRDTFYPEGLGKNN